MTDRKTAVVTGANRGIGLEVARGLLARGYSVWLGSGGANPGADAADELGGVEAGARMLRLDVTDDASVAAAAEALALQIDGLDVLVNNAGIATRSGKGQSDETLDAIKTIYEVNVFGSLRVTQAFLPLLRKSAEPRIVMVSSGLGSLSQAADPQSEFYGLSNLGYRSSKAALNAISIALAKELADTGFKVNAADPGLTATDLNGHAGNRSAAQGAAIVIRLATLDATGPTAGFFDDNGPVPW